MLARIGVAPFVLAFLMTGFCACGTGGDAADSLVNDATTDSVAVPDAPEVTSDGTTDKVVPDEVGAGEVSDVQQAEALDVEDSCGDGECTGAETKDTCPDDCGGGADVCGDGKCTGAETKDTCPDDCGGGADVCGDGKCTGAETKDTCPDDCSGGADACGDGKCTGAETKDTCPDDCKGGGPTPCSKDEDCLAAGACPPDAVKGCVCAQKPEGLFCTPACVADEDCPKPPDKTLICGPDGTCVPEGTGQDVCGDGKCTGAESKDTCPDDCSGGADVCGDGQCTGAETKDTCPDDCSGGADVCGDGKCTGAETKDTCPDDCKGGGKTPCSKDEDCAAPGACPPEAVKGCLCGEKPDGFFCTPACEVDADCPQPPDKTLVCGAGGMCVPQ